MQSISNAQNFANFQEMGLCNCHDRNAATLEFLLSFDLSHLQHKNCIPYKLERRSRPLRQEATPDEEMKPCGFRDKDATCHLIGRNHTDGSKLTPLCHDWCISCLKPITTHRCESPPPSVVTPRIPRHSSMCRQSMPAKKIERARRLAEAFVNILSISMAEHLELMCY